MKNGIVLSLLCAIVIYFFIYKNKVEQFDPTVATAALQNLSDMYNAGTLNMTNANVSGNIVAGNVEAKGAVKGVTGNFSGKLVADRIYHTYSGQAGIDLTWQIGHLYQMINALNANTIKVDDMIQLRSSDDKTWVVANSTNNSTWEKMKVRRG